MTDVRQPRRRTRRQRQILSLGIALLTTGLALPAMAQLRCGRIHSPTHRHEAIQATFQEVVGVMEHNPYSPEALPVIPLRMWSFARKGLDFVVGRRSTDILRNRLDYRTQGEPKPIHPMGVGLSGRIRIPPGGRFSGIFAGADLPVIARASISQGQPHRYREDGQPQKRSTALALKVFPGRVDQPVKTLNAVFQNDLNGLLRANGEPLSYLQSAQSNHPSLDFSKIREAYEVWTLLGVAVGSFRAPRDGQRGFPYINPQIRPVHSMAEFNVARPEDVRTPVWVQIRPRLSRDPVPESDFRLEILRTLERDGGLVYDLFAADKRDGRGQPVWEKIGEIEFDRAYLGAGVDQNLLFAHDNLNSEFTGRPFEIPAGDPRLNPMPDDLQ